MRRTLDGVVCVLTLGTGLAGQDPPLFAAPATFYASVDDLCDTRHVVHRIVDLDGDGHAEALISDRHGARLRVLRGEGALRWRRDVSELGSFAGRWSVFDFDGDGDRDLVGAGDVAKLAVIRQDVDGFGRLEVLLLQSGQHWLLDVDGDGAPDVVHSDHYSGRGWGVHSLDRFGNLGRINAPTPTRIMRPGGIAIDIDGDGLRDLFGFDRSGLPLLVENRGGGHLADGSWRLPSFPVSHSELFVSDVDADGDEDLIVAPAPDRYSIAVGPAVALVNDGVGRFTSRPLRLAATEPGSTIVAVGDLNGDGRDDVLAHDPNRGLVRCFNVADFVFLYVPAGWESVESPPAAGSLVDLDLDGAPDVIARGANDARLWINDRNSGFVPICRWRQLPGRDRSRAVASADFDRDGWPDLLGDGVRLNDRSGRFRRLATGPRNGVVVDVDRDGDPDVVDERGVHVNDGHARFAFVDGWLPPLAHFESVYAAEDVDGDGAADVLVIDPWQSWPRILRNDGRGRFTSAVGFGWPMPLGMNRLEDVDVVDVDGDGRRDLVLAGRAAHVLLLQSSPGVFQDASGRLGLAAQRVLSAPSTLVLDYDRDGDPDLLTIRSEPVLLENRGGHFVASGVLGSRYAHFTNPRYADFDDDGWPDLLLHFDRELLFHGRPGGGFDTPREVPLSGEHGGVLDLDRDGDVDLLDGGLNVVRQLALPSPPTLARGVTFEVLVRPGRSRSGTQALPFASARVATAPIAVPGTRGFLQLEPSSLLTLPSLPVPHPGGIAERTIELPDVTGLVGESFWLQCLVADPATPGGFGWTNPAEILIGW